MRFATGVVWAGMLSLALALPAPAASQVSIGLSGGLSLASLNGNDVDEDLGMRTGLNVGGFVEIPLADIVWLVPGVYYIQKGASSDVPNGTIKIDYVEVPLLARFGVSDRDPIGVNLFLGPTFAFQASCNFELANVSGSCEQQAGSNFDATKSFDFGFAVGGGLSFAVSDALKLQTNVLWDIGFISIDDSPSDADVTNEAILLNIGFAYRQGS